MKQFVCMCAGMSTKELAVLVKQLEITRFTTPCMKCARTRPAMDGVPRSPEALFP